MKKLFFISIVLLLGAMSISAGPNPIVRRLSQQEIAESTTPSAIAYNMVCAILQKDWEKMQSYMSLEAMIAFTDPYIRREYGEYGINSLEDFFSTGKLGILNWRDALYRGYEVAIAYVQDEWYYEENGSLYHGFDQVVKDGMIYLPGEDSPRVGINEKKVYVTCSPSSEVNYVGFQDITRYGDTNVKVLLQKFNGRWKVTGFK